MKWFDRGGVYFDDCEIKKQTDAAKLVLIPEIDSEPVWVPRSQIHDDTEIYHEGEVGGFVVNQWWAEKQEWI